MSISVSETSSSTPGERAWALHKVLTNKGLIPEGFIEGLTDLLANKFDPANGAQVVAKAWTDPAYRELLLRDGTAACEEFGFTGPQGEYIVALEDTTDVKMSSFVACVHVQIGLF